MMVDEQPLDMEEDKEGGSGSQPNSKTTPG